MSKQHFPAGWDKGRAQRVLEHYEAQSEDEAAFGSPAHTAIEVPVDLVPEFRELIAKREAG